MLRNHFYAIRQIFITTQMHLYFDILVSIQIEKDASDFVILTFSCKLQIQTVYWHPVVFWLFKKCSGEKN